jgi:hypothetical protein
MSTLQVKLGRVASRIIKFETNDVPITRLITSYVNNLFVSFYNY